MKAKATTAKQDDRQAAINVMAKQLYLIKQASEAKAAELKKFIADVERDDSEFLAGIPFEFEVETAEGKRKATGRLRLKNQRVWDNVDLAFERE